MLFKWIICSFTKGMKSKRMKTINNIVSVISDDGGLEANNVSAIDTNDI